MKNSVSFLFTLKSLLILMSWFSSDMPADRTIKITKFEWTLHLKLKLKLIVTWLQLCLSNICSYSISKRIKKKSTLNLKCLLFSNNIFKNMTPCSKFFEQRPKSAWKRLHMNSIFSSENWKMEKQTNKRFDKGLV